MADRPQVAALRAYVEHREHADHDTFSMGREFAELLLADLDRKAHNAKVWRSERDRLVAVLTEIADCDCHAGETARKALDSREPDGTGS